MPRDTKSGRFTNDVFSYDYHFPADEGTTVEQTPGLQARVRQVKGANEEVDQFRRENAGRATTGSVALKKQREAAERALERQIRLQRGQYPVRDAEK